MRRYELYGINLRCEPYGTHWSYGSYCSHGINEKYGSYGINPRYGPYGTHGSYGSHCSYGIEGWYGSCGAYGINGTNEKIGFSD